MIVYNIPYSIQILKFFTMSPLATTQGAITLRDSQRLQDGIQSLGLGKQQLRASNRYPILVN